jgi:hypothetical protein
MADQILTIIIEPRDGTVPFDSFVKIAIQTVELLRGVDRKTSPDNTDRIQWNISDVSMKSPLSLTLTGSPIKGKKSIRVDIPGSFVRDINRLEKGQRPTRFDDAMQGRAKALVAALSNGVNAIQFKSKNVEAKPTQQLAVNVDEGAKGRGAYYEVGSIEGVLDVLSVRGEDTIEVQDARHGIAVKCCVTESQLEDAWAMKRKRVSVRGRIKFKHGKPQSVVDVFHIRELAGTSAPQPEDIGVVDLTGGIDPVDYLRGEY